jgi:hypothetical protein
MIKDVVDRIDKRLKIIGLSASAASKKAGLGEDAIRDMKRAVAGKKSHGTISMRTLELLAPVLECSAAWLMTGQADAIRETTNSPVPIMGILNPGEAVEWFDATKAPLAMIDKPAAAFESIAAVLIHGDRLDAFFAGWFLFFKAKTSEITEHFIGKICLCELEDGTTIVRKLAHGTTPGRFCLLSLHGAPMLDVAVRAVCEVEAMLPSG